MPRRPQPLRIAIDTGGTFTDCVWIDAGRLRMLKVFSTPADPSQAIVGGGNSAGQAALFLSRGSARVHVIIRGETLQASMSRYLIDQIERDPRITVRPETQVTALLGTDQLDGVELADSEGNTSTLAVRGLFVFIGAQPSTKWLGGQLAEDSHGFLLTGGSIPEAQLDDTGQMPLFLETSRPGIFAIGDVRSE